MKTKRSIFVLLAAIIAALVLLYIDNYMKEAFDATENAAEGLGVMMGIAAARPYMIALGIGAVFAAVGYFFRLRWSALTGAILFAVSIVLLPAWLVFSLVPMILGFIGYARMKTK